MKRYIDADKLYADIAKDVYMLRDRINNRDYGMFLIGIKKKIDEAPTADVVEVTDKSLESLIKGLEILGDTENRADVVEVVRCKDCRHANECHKSVQYTRNEPNTVTIGYSQIEWCSRGERREE